ncbi:hypothetical protein Tco_0868840 [Tanacetum coccineum]
MNPSATQREETYQVALDIIKNTPFYNAFIIFADVPEIYMQQFWLTIKKVKKSSFYQFEIDSKTCQIDVELFREILDICPKVLNQVFTVPPSSSDSLIDFLLELGYKGQLPHFSQMYVDQMHQPWRTFGAIINKCLSWKTLSNDRLQLSRLRILWGMYHKENVDYAALIWFTKAIIHHFMTKHKSISTRHGSPYHTVDDDDMLKFINKEDIYQVYGKPIPDTWITDEIKKSEAYKMYFKYSIGLIPPKKGRGRGAQGTKATDGAPKQTNIVHKKTTDAFKKKQPKRKLVLHDESEGEPHNRRTGRRKRTPKAVVIQEPPSVPLEIDTQRAVKASRRESRFQHQAGGSSEGTGIMPGVPDELTGKSAISNEGASTSLEVPDETKDKIEVGDDLDYWGSTNGEEYLHESDNDNDERNESDDEEEDDDKGTDIEETDNKETE